MLRHRMSFYAGNNRFQTHVGSGSNHSHSNIECESFSLLLVHMMRSDIRYLFETGNPANEQEELDILRRYYTDYMDEERIDASQTSTNGNTPHYWSVGVEEYVGEEQVPRITYSLSWESVYRIVCGTLKEIIRDWANDREYWLYGDEKINKPDTTKTNDI